MAFTIGFVLLPNVTQLDLTGPLQVLHRLPDAGVHIAAKTLKPRGQRLRPGPGAHDHVRNMRAA
jgi:hypothetical protein